MSLADRVAAARRLQPDTPAVGERIMAAVESAIPAYATLPEGPRRETRAIATWAVQRLLEMWVDGSTLTEADRRRFHGVGVARATDGRPLLAVLRAYRVAAVEATDLVLEGSRSTLDVDDVVALNRTLLTSIEDLSEALFGGYTLAQDRLADDRERSLGGLVHDLPSGRHVSRDVLRDRSAQLGITLPDRWCVIVAAPLHDQQLTAGDAADFAAVVPRPGGATVLHLLREETVVVLVPDAADPPAVADELAFRGWRACLIDGTATDRLPETCRVATDCVLAANETVGGGDLLGLADALYVGMLVGNPAVEPTAMAAATLGALTDLKHRHLLDGVRAYLHHGSATEAATALGLHPQTMRYRLRRAASLTGRDLGESWNRLLVHTAVTVWDARRRS